MDWSNNEAYRLVEALPAASCAWEFLRRNPDYQSAYRLAFARPTQQVFSFLSDGSTIGNAVPDAAPWHLVRFEDPTLDAARANVFWQPESWRGVIPLLAIALPDDEAERRPSFPPMQCRVTTHRDLTGKHHVLFAQEGRFLQLEIHGAKDLRNIRLTTDVLISAERARDRLRALKRLTDLLAHGTLRRSLYPAESRGRRFARILQVFDGWRAGASHREIAAAIVGETRVAAHWRDPSEQLRDWVRRTLRSGRRLVAGGYISLLK